MEKDTHVRDEYIDRSLGFPVVLRDVPMRKVRGEWVLDVDPNRFQQAVLWGLVHKPGRLTGDEIRFVRQWMGLTMTEFGDRLDVTHPAVVKWENTGSSPTNMSMGTDVLIRLEILVELPDEVWSREQADTSEESPTFEPDDVRALIRTLSSLEREPPAESVELHGESLRPSA